MHLLSKHSLNGNKKKFFYSACIIKKHIIIIKLIGKIFNLTTCSPVLLAFVVVFISGAIVVLAESSVLDVIVSCAVAIVVSATVVVGSSVVAVEAENFLNLNCQYFFLIYRRNKKTGKI